MLALLVLLSAQSIKLNGPMIPTNRGEVRAVQVANDGHTLVYSADHDDVGIVDIYAAEVDASAPPLQLSRSVDTNTNVREFALATTSARVAFIAGPIPSLDALYSVPLDGSQLPLKLSGPYTVRRFVLLSSADAAVFATDERTFPGAILRVPLDGSTAPVPVIPTPGQPSCSVTALFTSPDGSRVVYELLSIAGSRQLFSAPTDGSLAPTALSLLSPINGKLDSLQFSPDGTRVLYIADYRSTAIDLFSAPIDGSAPAVKLNGLLNPFTHVIGDVHVSPDGAWVLYATSERGRGKEILRVPIGGGRRHAFAPRHTGVSRFAFTPDGTQVVVQSSAPGLGDALFVHGFGRAAHRNRKTRLSLPGAASHRVASWAITPDGARVVYVSNERRGSDEAFTVELDRDAPPRRLSGAASAGRAIGRFALSNDGRTVVYWGAHSLTNADTFAVPADGSAPEVRLAAGYSALPTLLFSRDDTRVLFLAEDALPFTAELFGVRVDATAPAARISGQPPVDFFGVRGYSLTPTSDRVLYLAQQDLPNTLDLYSVPVDGSAAPVRLSDLPQNRTVVAFEGSPDGATAYFLANREDFNRLYAAPVDGSLAPARLAPLSVGEVLNPLRVAPGGARVVFRATGLGARHLYSVPADGSQAAVLLTSDFAANVESDFQVTSDASSVVFRRSGRLWSVPTAGGAAPLQLTATLTSPLPRFLLTPDGQRVVVSDQNLMMVPVDGSRPPLVLAGATGPFEVGGLGQNVFYVRAGMFSAAVDGSTAPIALNGSLAFVQSFTLGPGRVFFRVGLRGDIYVSSVNGQQGPFPLHSPFSAPSQGSFAELLVSTPASRIVYYADADQPGQFEIYSVPFNGSQPPVRLDPGFSGAPQLSPDGATVVYHSFRELYAVPIQGGTRTRLHGAMTGSSSILRCKIAAGRRVVYWADQDLVGVFELYSSTY